MTHQVVDLVSSSPPTGPPACGRQAEVEGCPYSSAGAALDAPLLLWESDEQAPLRRSVNALDSKRRRLSSPPGENLLRGVSGNAKDLPSIRRIATGQHVKRAPEPIELTSSPLVGGDSDLKPPSRLHSLRNAFSRVAARTTQTITGRNGASSSDPFASSSPHPASRALAINLHIQDQSSDPFGSSPPPAGGLDPSSKSPRDRHDLHEESARRRPNIAPSRRQSKQRQALEAISSSMPDVERGESLPTRSSSAVVEHSAGVEVISVEESGSQSGSDDELPDVADFDLSRGGPRVRNPPTNPQMTKKKSSKTASHSTADEKAKARMARAARAASDAQVLAKTQDKERKAREREETRAAKAREKAREAALVEANKARTDRKVSTREMIVDLPASLEDAVDVHVRTLLEDLDVQHVTMETPMPNLIQWRRKVSSRFSDELGCWEPTALRVEPEKNVLVLMKADEFVRLALADELGAHVDEVKLHCPNCTIVYLMEGLTSWLRKNRCIRNRQFTSGVRSQDGEARAPTRRRRDAQVQEYVSEDVVEEALLDLQVTHDVLIHHTTIPLETAQWIATLTQHVSTIPYKKQQDRNTLGAGFCMESGQVRTGQDVKDTYLRMLQEILRVTAPIAYGVAAEFGSVTRLVNGLEAGGPKRLEEVRRCANRDGALSERSIGQAASRRLHRVFTGRDETSTDV